MGLLNKLAFWKKDDGFDDFGSDQPQYNQDSGGFGQDFSQQPGQGMQQQGQQDPFGDPFAEHDPLAGDGLSGNSDPFQSQQNQSDPFGGQPQQQQQQGGQMQFGPGAQNPPGQGMPQQQQRNMDDPFASPSSMQQPGQQSQQPFQAVPGQQQQMGPSTFGHQEPSSPPRQPSSGSAGGKEIDPELLYSKLDTLRALMDNVNSRLSSIEDTLRRDNRRW